MTNEEIVAVIQSRSTDKTALMELLYKQNEGMMRKVAAKHAAEKRDVFDELMQEAYFALDYASEHYDASAGVKFITYFTTLLNHHFYAVKMRASSPLSMPREVMEQLYRYRKWKMDYLETHETPPTPERCCFEMKWKREKIDAMEMLFCQMQTVSIDAPLADGDDLTIGDMIADEINIENGLCDDAERRYLYEILHTALARDLESSEQSLMLRYYNGVKMKQICAEMGLQQG